MIEYSIQPWETWPRKETPHYDRRMPFKAKHEDTLEQLGRELMHMGARDVVVQVKVRRSDIRMDGMLRSDAVASHPGVILAFTRNGKTPMSMACDACGHWKQNLRALVLTLERLRMADLYGVTRSGEQYRGWEALPPPGATAGASMTKDQALDIIAKYSGMPQDLILGEPVFREAAVKKARIATHPDKTNNTEESSRVAEAAGILEDTCAN